ncbi:MAG: transcriptional repressor [Peptococcaceae bacterium]|nr:transcriptional repressor [Peptococcaceae bacterium]
MSRYAKMILEMINDSRQHLTAEQIFLALKKSQPKIVLATVYNNLNALSKAGLIRKITMEGSPDRYDRIERHDHLVCRRCGKLSDMTFEDLTKELEKQLGAGIVSYDLRVYYVCPECRAKEAAEHKEKDAM